MPEIPRSASTRREQHPLGADALPAPRPATGRRARRSRATRRASAPAMPPRHARDAVAVLLARPRAALSLCVDELRAQRPPARPAAARPRASPTLAASGLPLVVEAPEQEEDEVGERRPRWRSAAAPIAESAEGRRGAQRAPRSPRTAATTRGHQQQDDDHLGDRERQSSPVTRGQDGARCADRSTARSRARRSPGCAAASRRRTTRTSSDDGQAGRGQPAVQRRRCGAGASSRGALDGQRLHGGDHRRRRRGPAPSSRARRRSPAGAAPGGWGRWRRRRPAAR